MPSDKLTELQQAMVDHDDDMARLDRNTLPTVPTEAKLFRIKPLEWGWFDGTLDGILKARGYMAKTPVFYAVVFQEERPNPDKWSEWRWYATNTLNTPCASPKEGKQLAEAHWNEYIQQALIEVEQQ